MKDPYYNPPMKIEINLKDFFTDMMGTPFYQPLRDYVKQDPMLSVFLADGVLNEREFEALKAQLGLDYRNGKIEKDLYRLILERFGNLLKPV
ncbi:MAG: hypothetical protein HRT47_01415 [Candidatus Caenarcaniphilales bacterium]|nr:hypothetical protein [Candidatus Caenarcaniphilales bacterium]